MTVNELYKECKMLIESGDGGKEVWLSDDDEGNGYHCLYYSFMTEQDEIDICLGAFAFIPEDKNNVVILG